MLVTGVELGPNGAAAPPVAVTLANPSSSGSAAPPPPGSNGAVTMSWATFAAWYTPNTHHGGIWAGQWVLIANGIDLTE